MHFHVVMQLRACYYETCKIMYTICTAPVVPRMTYFVDTCSIVVRSANSSTFLGTVRTLFEHSVYQYDQCSRCRFLWMIKLCASITKIFRFQSHCVITFIHDMKLKGHPNCIYTWYVTLFIRTHICVSKIYAHILSMRVLYIYIYSAFTGWNPLEL